jgi:predicted amidophosphoribosyltransferase
LELVHRYKYEGWEELADAMARSMAVVLRPLPRIASVAGAVPVPGRGEPRRDHAERLAAALGRVLGIPVHPTLLERVRENAPQVRLPREARWANVVGAFAARRPVRGPVLLVDDVTTTGSTLLAAAAAIRRAGGVPVGAAFCRSKHPLWLDRTAAASL